MKKCSFILVIALCLAAMLATGALGAETTFSGSYRIRAHSEVNIDKEVRDDIWYPFITHDEPLTTSWFDQRFRLTITHTRSEYLKAVLRLNIVEDTWGQGRAFRMNADNSDYIDLAYIEFTVPKIGTFTAGLFDEEYGHGLSISRGHTSSSLFGFSGIRWKNAWGPVEVSAMYAKEIEGGTFFAGSPGNISNADSDLFALDVKITPVENHTLELYGGYYKERFGVTDFPWSIYASTRSSFVTWYNFNLFLSPIIVRDTDIGFVGVAYTGTLFDMIDIKGEYTHFFGTGDAYFNPSYPSISWWALMGAPMDLLPPEDIDIRGFNLYADVSLNMDLFRVGVAFLMGSGQDHIWSASSYDRVNINGYQFNDGLTWATILVPGDLEDLNTIQPVTWGVENLTSIKLYFEVFPIENLTIRGAAIWAKWTKPVGYATPVNNFDLTARGGSVNSKGSGYLHPMMDFGNYWYDSWEVSTDLGWEFDLGFSWRILDGLTYSCDAGVLLTGDSFDYAKWNGTSFEREEWGPIWRVVNTLTYEF